MKAFLKYFQRKSYPDFFNTPIKVFGEKLYINERIVEKPFIHRTVCQIATDKPLQSIRTLELGHTRSEIALELASSGIRVTGVDLRPYGFEHDNFQEICKDIEDYTPGRTFEFIYSVSVLEHVGLGAYGEAPNDRKLYRVLEKLAALLSVDGILAITVPFGKAHQDSFLRSFDEAQLMPLLESCGLDIAHEEYYVRKDMSMYLPADKDEIREVSNLRENCGPTGVNGVGCFHLKKK